MGNDPLSPSPSLLAKLGSIAVHVEEFFETIDRRETDAAQFDREAIHGLLVDADVREWLAAMRKLAMLPEKR